MEINELVRLAPGEEKKLSIPYADIELSYDGDSLQYFRLDEETGEVLAEKSFLTTTGRDVELKLTPVYPDRPIVFKPETEVTVLPKRRVTFFLTLPLAYTLQLTRSESNLEEVLDTVRKNTYWGPPTSGVLAYEHQSSLWTNEEAVYQEAAEPAATVPVVFVNQLDDEFLLNKLLVPLCELEIYLTSSGVPIFRSARVEQRDGENQVSRPADRHLQDLDYEQKICDPPSPPRSLLEKVSKFSGWGQLTGVFGDR